MAYRTFILLFFFSFGINAQNSTKNFSLEEYIVHWKNQNDIKGISISIQTKEGSETVVSGWKNATKDSIKKHDSFMISSVTKTFTAAAILKLAEKGVFKLNQSAARLSGLPIPEKITVSQLLHHEAGMPEYMGKSLSFDVFLKKHSQGKKAWSSEDIRSYATKPNLIENASFSYSNSHYIVLGSIIEKQYGKSLQVALDELIFKPFHLKSAKLIKTASDTPNALGNSNNIKAILGTSEINSRLTQELATAGEAAGGMKINSSDLAKWVYLYFGDRFVGNISFKDPKGNSAFGLNSERIKVGPGMYKVNYNKQKVRLHGGDGLGNTSLVMYDPAMDKSIAILVNDDKIHSLGFGKSPFLDALAIKILEHF